MRRAAAVLLLTGMIGSGASASAADDGLANLVPVILVDTDPANPRPPFTVALE